MEPQTNTSSPLNAKYIFIGISMLIFSGAIGAVLGGKYYPREKVIPQVQNSLSYTMPSASYTNTNAEQENHSIVGTVGSINGSSFSINESSRQILSKTAGARTIVVTRDTKIVKGVVVADMETFSREEQAYFKKMQDAKNQQVLSLPPQMMSYTEAGPEDIKIGDDVLVTTIENIGSQDTLFASKVQIEPKLEKTPKK